MPVRISQSSPKGQALSHEAASPRPALTEPPTVPTKPYAPPSKFFDAAAPIIAVANRRHALFPLRYCSSIIFAKIPASKWSSIRMPPCRRPRKLGRRNSDDPAGHLRVPLVCLREGHATTNFSPTRV